MAEPLVRCEEDVNFHEMLRTLRCEPERWNKMVECADKMAVMTARLEARLGLGSDPVR